MTNQHWALIDQSGEVRGQVITDGEEPWRDLEDGWSAVKVSRFGDLTGERLNTETKRWNKDAEKKAAFEAKERRHRQIGDMTLPELEALVRRIVGEVNSGK